MRSPSQLLALSIAQQSRQLRGKASRETPASPSDTATTGTARYLQDSLQPGAAQCDPLRTTFASQGDCIDRHPDPSFGLVFRVGSEAALKPLADAAPLQGVVVPFLSGQPLFAGPLAAADFPGFVHIRAASLGQPSLA